MEPAGTVGHSVDHTALPAVPAWPGTVETAGTAWLVVVSSAPPSSVSDGTRLDVERG